MRAAETLRIGSRPEKSETFHCVNISKSDETNLITYGPERQLYDKYKYTKNELWHQMDPADCQTTHSPSSRSVLPNYIFFFPSSNLSVSEHMRYQECVSVWESRF